MGEIKGFGDLKVWQKSHELVLEVYKVTQEFPSEEKLGWTSQNLILQHQSLKPKNVKR